MAGPQLFIVRIVHAAGRFAARARRVDDEVTGEFGRPQQLMEFLLQPPPPSAPPPAAPACLATAAEPTFNPGRDHDLDKPTS